MELSMVLNFAAEQETNTGKKKKKQELLIIHNWFN